MVFSLYRAAIRYTPAGPWDFNAHSEIGGARGPSRIAQSRSEKNMSFLLFPNLSRLSIPTPARVDI